jgi:signal recognition particle subunit SRP54
VFTGLSSRLEEVFRRLKSRGKLTEANIREALREVRLALLEADVNYGVVKTSLSACVKKPSALKCCKV